MLAATAASASAAPTVQAPDAPPLAAFTQPGELFVLTVAGAKATCVSWTVRARGEGVGELVRGELAIEYVNMHGELSLLNWTRAEASGTCNQTFAVSETADAVVVGGARWFRTAASCAKAIATKQRVAMDWRGCGPEPAVAAADAARTKQRFARTLAKGGTLYAIDGDRCEALTATPHRSDLPDTFAGSLSWRVRDGKLTGKAMYGYRHEPAYDQVTLLGPNTLWSDGVASGFPCASVTGATYARDAIELGDRLYLSKASCAAGLAHARARRRWQPPPRASSRDDEEERIDPRVEAGTVALGRC